MRFLRDFYEGLVEGFQFIKDYPMLLVGCVLLAVLATIR